MIERLGKDGFVATGKGISLVQLNLLKSGLNLEIRTNGALKMTRGPQCSTRIKRQFGFKGNKQSLMEQLDALIAKTVEEMHKDAAAEAATV